MAKWADDGTRLDLGALGEVTIYSVTDGECMWRLTSTIGARGFTSKAAARRDAVAWLRHALKQASKRLEAK